MNETEEEVIVAVSKLEKERAGPEIIAKAGSIERKGGGVKASNAASGFGDAPGIAGGVIEVGNIAGSISQSKRGEIDGELAARSSGDGQRAIDVEQIPTRVCAFRAAGRIDFPGVMAAAIPGLGGGVHGA